MVQSKDAPNRPEKHGRKKEKRESLVLFCENQMGADPRVRELMGLPKPRERKSEKKIMLGGGLTTGRGGYQEGKKTHTKTPREKKNCQGKFSNRDLRTKTSLI